VAEFVGVRFHQAPAAVLGVERMPGAEWFPGATLNYAEHVLSPGPGRGDGDVAVVFAREDGLERQVTRAESLRLQMDLGPGERFFWFTTTGWMMWNLLVSGLLVGATVVLFDGNPGYPDLSVLWRLAERHHISYFGTSAPFIQSCLKAGLRPRDACDLPALRAVGSTGSPLSADGFRWLADAVGRRVQICSISGGTDLCTPFLGAAPTVPVAFWNDPDGTRLGEAYFDAYPGVWRHGDWVRVTPRDSYVIYRRSDSTLNRGGIRMGTADFYAVVEGFDQVADSLVIETTELGADQGQLLCFLVLAPGVTLTDIEPQLRRTLRSELSPRHVPDRFIVIDEVPRTLSGKKLEVPVKKILACVPADQAVSKDALQNPETLTLSSRWRRSEDTAARIVCSRRRRCRIAAYGPLQPGHGGSAG
jgi:acetoacetyl-CoA synthetase